jgi:hypothetical protein
MSPIRREQFPVPRAHRETYLAPPPEEHAAVVDRNRRLLTGGQADMGGRPLAQVRAAARTELVAAARRWTARWGVSTPDWAEPAPLIVTGHQPQPFHPGVWIKNFVAGDLARAVGGAALNLVVDSDEGRGQVIRLPARGPAGGEEVRTAEVALADGSGGAAFEEQPAAALRRAALREVLAAAPAEAVGQAFRTHWAVLEETAACADSLGGAMAAARRVVEEGQGLANLELPVSVLADSCAFRRFLAALLDRHEAFFAAYNDSLGEYRRAYDEENPAQPMPDLSREGVRLEMPYWVWRAGERRRRLWVEPAEGGGLALAADAERIGRLEPAERADLDDAAARLADLREDGWKVRPRALALTLLARLVVGDVFVHGLGGALYDRIADALIERFFGMPPPEIIIASATVHLPLEAYPATRATLAEARRAVRDWRYNPGRVMPDIVRDRPQAQALIEEKRSLIQRRGETRAARHRAWRRIRQVNAALAALCPEGPEAAAARLDRIECELRWNAVLRGRAYPYLLYSPADLAAFYREGTRAYEPPASRLRADARCGVPAAPAPSCPKGPGP